MAHSAPILSTPAEHILQEPTPQVVQSREQGVLSEEQLYLQYEIKRTISEIRAGQWKRIALQFPDDMLVDAPRVFERLRDGLKHERAARAAAAASENEDEKNEEKEEKLCILGDTSYGSCCVDEVAAEHTDADVVVHYGRACLSPTARLPVIYVFTAKSLDLDAVVASFKETYPPSSQAEEKVCLMADIPYSHHLDELYRRLTEEEGYGHIFKTSIIHDPASLIPNRTTPVTITGEGGEEGGIDEAAATAALKEYSIFHISEPPTSLLLILSSRIKSLHIFPTTPSSSSPSSPSSSPPPPTHLASTTTTPLLRRRYALITRLSTIPIFGILINTLSVSHYLQALQHCQRLIHASGKKSYTFVVGKINAAKLANFSEIGGWVVIGCWESSLLENGSKEFFRPVITPWELEVALMRDRERVWGGEWVGDFGEVLERGRGKKKDQGVEGGEEEGNHDDEEGPTKEEQEDEDQEEESSSDSESSPPDFDLRTGQYVSHSRPMGHPRRRRQHSNPQNPNPQLPSTSTTTTQLTHLPKTSSALTTTPFHINGHLSPAAEYLSSQRTWTGLGSDFSHSSHSHHADADAEGASIAYERDENGKIRGAEMEEGRKGVAKGYRVGDGDDGREG